MSALSPNSVLDTHLSTDTSTISGNRTPLSAASATQRRRPSCTSSSNVRRFDASAPLSLARSHPHRSRREVCSAPRATTTLSWRSSAPPVASHASSTPPSRRRVASHLAITLERAPGSHHPLLPDCSQVRTRATVSLLYVRSLYCTHSLSTVPYDGHFAHKLGLARTC